MLYLTYYFGINCINMIALILFLFGSVIGSFLNVCIWRLPREESIVRPGSHCPHCQKLIPWYDNMPFLSFILLGGRCRFCKERISWRYPVVELLAALAPVWVISQMGFQVETLVYTILLWGLIVVIFVDAVHQIIPDQISLGGLALGVLASTAYPSLHQALDWLGGLRSSLVGAAVGAGSIYLTGVVGRWIFKREAMGLGDVKLMAMIGSFLGWQMSLFVFFLAPFFGTVVGLWLKYVKKTDVIPYGPFLSLATFVVIFWGHKILGGLVPF